MSTTKSEDRKSRRSSILKPPKTRQPLQNVELNASSTENSPATSTLKIKRRVSFAEKKHVKEFCDSMEQGTVWDNTYEESELSHRNSQNSNDENSATVEFPNESSKSHPRASVVSGAAEESVVRESTFTGPKSRSSTSSIENPSISDLNPPLAGCDPTIEDSVFGIAPTKIPYPTNHFGSIKARRSLSASDFAERNAFDEKSSFRARAQTCPTIDSHARRAVRDDLPISASATEAREDHCEVVPTIGDASTEPRDFVDEEPISDSPKIGSKLEEEIALAKISVEHEKFTIFHDTSMEITEAVSNFAKKSSAVESREKSSLAAEIATFGAKTLEFKEVSETVTSSTRTSIVAFVDENPISEAPKYPSAGPMIDSKLEEEMARLTKNSVAHEKFTIFHDTSMEITEAVSNLAKKRSFVAESREESESTMFGTKTVEFKEALCKTVDHPGFGESDPRKDLPREKSISHRDKSMDFTEVAPTIPGSGRSRYSQIERTKIFEDKSVDFTDIVGNFAGMENLRRSPTERTNIFHDKSMEFTEAVQNVRILNQREKSPTERTKIFHDNSMEFTEAVQNVRIPKQREKSPTERTKIFHDKSLEFTEAVQNVQILNQREKSPTERTKIFHDKSMEFTEAVQNVRIPKQREKSPTERTKIFHDNSMEFTEAVQNVRIPNQREKSPPERTKIFHDKSVEFTEAVQNVRIPNQREKSPTEPTKIFHKSMEFTEVVENFRIPKLPEKSPTERTKIFHDNSMEFTEAVQDFRILNQREKSPPERTKIFHDKSMEFTEAVKNVRITKHREKSPTEPTKIFHKSMEFTEVVENSRIPKLREKSPTERTKIFHDESIDFTEVVGNFASTENPRKLPTERTEIFHDKSMEFTEAVQNVRITKQREKSPTERTKIFHDESIDFTEIVRKLPCSDDRTNREFSPGRSTIFRNESPNSAEKIPALRSAEKNLPDDPRSARSSIFRDRSTIDLKPSVEKQHEDSLGEPETEERNIFENRQTHEVPEVVQKILRAPKLGSRESSYALDARLAIVAKKFVPAFQKPRSEEPELEIRPPLPKRMKSIGDKSTDLTAAISFIKFAGKKKQTSEESSAGSTSPEAIAERFSERNTDFRNESMEETEIAQSHSARLFLPSAEDIPIFESKSAESSFVFSRPADRDDDSRRPRNTTLLGDESMEITGVVPGIVRAENIKFGDNPKTTIFHDQSMEMTVAVSRPALSRFVTTSGETRLPENCEARSTVFREDCVELAGPVRTASNSKERKYTNEDEAVHWSDPSKFDHEGKTVLFRDDQMELTGAMGFNLRTEVPIIDKENCPVGLEDFRRRGARLFEDESRIASKSEWLGKRKSFRCSSSHTNEDNLRVRAEPEERNRDENFGSDDVTGVVAFSSQINDNEYEGGAEERDYPISGNDSGTLILGNESLEMTGVVPWSADPDVNRRSRPAGSTDDLPIVDKIRQRSSQSQVVKELFQKPITSDVYADEKIEPASVNERTGTADLEAEMRKLAESFALEDESGFDQATFLRQQARCMEDYEANSTASQDCEPPTQSVRADGRSASNESSDSEKSDDWERSPNRKNANAFARDVSPGESQCFSSKSLEELRNRAYSVGKFQPEAIGCELTAPISKPSSDDFHRTIMLEDLEAVEPPSFLEDLGHSVRSARSMSELPTESAIGVKLADGEMRGDEAISRIWEDTPNVSDPELTIPEITETVNMERILDERRSENSGERMERKKLHRTQTSEMIKQIYDPRISASSSEISDDRAKNHRRSSTGVTTADEFSSESADGPSEKLRRGESVIPTEDKVEKSAKFTDIDRSWDGKNFASSTVIVDDFTRQMMHRFVEENSVVLENSLFDELPSAIDADEEENVGRSASAEEAACYVAMETEASLCKSPFEALQEIIKNLAGRSETIWTIIRFDEKMLALHFFSKSIVLAIHFNDTSDAITNPIKVIGFLSQLDEDGTDPGVSLAHSLIMKKIDSASLTRSYRTYEDIPQMLEFVTTEVKLGMDFMFELDRLRNRNVMEICGNRIIFMVRTRDINAGIILKLTMEIKPFAEINSNDITISCILGSDKVRENDIKRLITNVKRDHRFLRFYMNDVKDYVDLMAETGFSASSGTGCH